MPTPTYVAIAKTVLTGTQLTVTFSSIPQTYTDLLLTCSARSDFSPSYSLQIRVRPNSNSASEYSLTRLNGDGSTATSNRSSSSAQWLIYGALNGASSTSNTFASSELYLPNYTGSTNKVGSATGVVEGNTTTAGQTSMHAIATLLSNTAAITSLELQASDGSFVSGSRFDLYGIKNS